jgi:hypothetical protein
LGGLKEEQSTNLMIICPNTKVNCDLCYTNIN